ncbi:PTS transporter subunit EIIC [Paenibacillus rhizoplanae]
MNWLGSLQQLGRAIMLPTMVLPAAAILLSLGSLPWSAWGLSSVSEVTTYAGQGIFYFMPYLFAVGVAWGLSNQAGPAGLAALAGMFTYDRIVSNMGDGAVQPATLIGIILGIVAGVAHNRFKNIKLPEAIQFFWRVAFCFCCSWAYSRRCSPGSCSEYPRSCKSCLISCSG